MKKTNYDIVKSNALIEAFYNPGSVYQMRLLIAALMQIKAGETLDHKRRFEITANALADLTGQKALANYRELKKAAGELSRLIMVVKEKPNAEIGAPDETHINVTSACRYYDKEGKVGFKFGPEIIPYLSALKKRFTKYQAKHVMPMRSSYGVRLYELCLQWLGEEREFEVIEFRRMFGLENKYKSIKDLKLRVITPALNDINTHSDIRVRFGQRKAGVRVTHFQFAITRPEKPVPLDHQAWFNRYGFEKPYTPHGTGETWYDAKRRTYYEYRKYCRNPETWHEAWEKGASNG